MYIMLKEVMFKLLRLGHIAGQKSAGKTDDQISNSAANEYASETYQHLIASVEKERSATTVSAGEAASECYECMYKNNVPGNTHIECIKPDPYMIGDPHGVKNGWFMYPVLFDPVWKLRKCSNFESR